MDDSTSVNAKQLWRTGQPHGDEENGDTGNVADDSNSRRGSPKWLPRPSRGFRRLKPLTLDMNLPPPFLVSSSYPSTVESAPSPSSYILDYFDIGGEGLLPPAIVDDDMRFHHYPHPSIYDPVDSGEAYAWDPHSRFFAFWEAGDDSDTSEPSDESTDYITFTSRSASVLPELELGFQQLSLSELSPSVLDFPEDVGESLEHDAVLADGDSCVIDGLGQPSPVPASETPAELSTQPYDDSQTLPVSTPDILVPRTRGEDSHVPISVPVSPFVTDGFPDDTTTLSSDLASGEAGGISVDADWLDGSLGEMICSPRLGEEFMEWNRWRGQLIEELDRDLDSWAEVRKSGRAGL